MDSTLKPKPTDDPHDFIVVAPNAVGVAPADEELSKLLQQAAGRLQEAEGRSTNPQAPAAPEFSAGASPLIDTTFRPTAVNDESQVPGARRSIGKAAARAFTALVLATCIGMAAVAWQSNGEVVKQTIAKWAPRFSLTSLLPQKKEIPAQPNPAPIQAVTENPAAPQPAPTAQPARESVAPAAATAAPSPQDAQLLQSIAHDLATMGQEIALLKGSVEQLTASIEQLKASQEQISRDIAKPPSQNLRPKISAPSRPAAAPVRKPAPPFPSPQAAAAPAPPQVAAPSLPPQAEPPSQAATQPPIELAPRPPMPVR